MLLPFASRIYFLLLLLSPVNALWWVIGSPMVMDPNSTCRKSRQMGSRQRDICRNEPEVVEEILVGARMALLECQEQFRHRRWNCPASKKALRRMLKWDTRESSFVSALVAAGVVEAITQACTSGRLEHCACREVYYTDTRADGQWEWGGCSDDPTFAVQTARDFLDVRRGRKRTDIRTLVHLHNHQAGRLAVTNHMRIVCKCHGLSGSCTLKTCWEKTPMFSTVGRHLKEKFDGSPKMVGSNDGKELIPENKGVKPPEVEDLIYTEPSPNFCEPNKRYGAPGTRGRICEPRSLAVGGCDLLCCGRGYQTTRVTVVENCECQFRWCCEVICKTCKRRQTVYRCL